MPNQVISTLNVDKNFVTFVVTIFSSSAKPTDNSKQTISSQIFIFEINSHMAAFSEEIVEIKCDPHKILNNTYLYRFFCSKVKSFHNE